MPAPYVWFSVDLVIQPLALCRQWGPTFCKHDRQTCRQAPVRFTFCDASPDSVPVWVSLRGCLEDYKTATGIELCSSCPQGQQAHAVHQPLLLVAAHTSRFTDSGQTMTRDTALARKALGHRTVMTPQQICLQNASARSMPASCLISAVTCLRIGPAMGKLTQTFGNMNGTNMVSSFGVTWAHAAYMTPAHLQYVLGLLQSKYECYMLASGLAGKSCARTLSQGRGACCDTKFFRCAGSCAITYEKAIGGSVTTEHEFFAKALELRDQCNVLVSCYMPDAPVILCTDTSTSHEKRVLQRRTCTFIAALFDRHANI